MKKPIQVSKILNDYRNTLYSKYPEPKKMTQEEREAAELAKKTGKDKVPEKKAPEKPKDGAKPVQEEK